MLWTAPPLARECHGGGKLLELPRFGGTRCKTVTTVGLDFNANKNV
jgi:hypothetical protein